MDGAADMGNAADAADPQQSNPFHTASEYLFLAERASTIAQQATTGSVSRKKADDLVARLLTKANKALDD